MTPSPRPLPPATTYDGPVPRVVYADVDGTLTHEGSLFMTPAGPSLSAARALHALITRGVDVVLVSGRTSYALWVMARTLGQRRAIAELGACIVEDPGATVTPTLPHLPREARTADRILAEGVPEHLFKAFPDRLEYHAPWHLGRDFTVILRGTITEAEGNRVLQEAYPQYELLDNGEVRGGKHAYHIAPRGVGKPAGIRFDRERHGIPREATAAVGDSLQDATMASEVGAFFLVGGDGAPGPANAYATRGKAGDGFAEAVEALLRLPAGSLSQA